MRWNKGRRVGLAVLSGALVAVAAGGLTAMAVSGAPRTVYACASKGGRLALESASGRCAAGSAKVALNRQGPRGPQGAPGPAGPGARALTVQSTSSSPDPTSSTTLAAMGLRITLSCHSMPFTALFINSTSGSTGWLFTGSYGNESNGTAQYGETDSNSTFDTSLDAGGGAFTQTLTSRQTAHLELTQGQVGATVLIQRGTRTATVTIDLESGSSRCFAVAQVTPSS